MNFDDSDDGKGENGDFEVDKGRDDDVEDATYDNEGGL